MIFLSCEECNLCCTGNLAGKVHGISFGDKTPCAFLCNSKCLIYNTRPKMCIDYQCAWSQGLFTHQLKPTISNLLISVENKQNKKQFLKIVCINNDISDQSIDYLNAWVKQNDTFYELVGANDEIKYRFGIQKD